MKLYSYQGQEPTELPQRFRLKNGLTITKLSDLPEEELISYGFIPVEVPSGDLYSQGLVWDGKEYSVSDKVLNRIESEKIKRDLIGEEFKLFLEEFKLTSFYKRIRKESSEDLKTNIFYSEFIAFLPTSSNFSNIIDYLNKFFLIIPFSKEEISDLEALITKFDLNLAYTIPNQEYIEKHCYDLETDTIADISIRPFESWVWSGYSWIAPVPYPNDKNNYIWNEKSKGWKKI